MKDIYWDGSRLQNDLHFRLGLIKQDSKFSNLWQNTKYLKIFLLIITQIIYQTQKLKSKKTNGLFLTNFNVSRESINPSWYMYMCGLFDKDLMLVFLNKLGYVPNFGK